VKHNINRNIFISVPLVLCVMQQQQRAFDDGQTKQRQEPRSSKNRK
jgi:hypothetical protein